MTDDARLRKRRRREPHRRWKTRRRWREGSDEDGRRNGGHGEHG